MKSHVHSQSIRTVRALSALAFSLVLAASVQAAPVTGDPLPAGPFVWNDGGPKSTNALNYAEMTPGHVGGISPYVLFNSNTPSSVTLDFFNMAPGVEYFEYRIDGVDTGTTPHEVVIGDKEHPGVFLWSDTSAVETFTASHYVDVRLALGGESDFRFDWTRFQVASVPDAGSTLALLGVGLAAIGLVRRRKCLS